MKKFFRRNTNYISLGVLLFILIIVMAIIIIRICYNISFVHRYGDIIRLAEKNGLSINSIEQSSLTGVEIYCNNKSVNTKIMKSYYSFGQELADYLNGHKKLFDDDENIVRVWLSFGGVEKQSATHSVAAESSPSADRYEFTAYYCRFKTDFEGISYIKNAKKLYLTETVSSLKGIENFKRLEYLYIDPEADIEEGLSEKLPNCVIEFKKQGVQEMTHGKSGYTECC